MLPNLYLFPKLVIILLYLFSFYSKWLLQPMKADLLIGRQLYLLWKISFSSGMKTHLSLLDGNDFQQNFVYITAEIIKLTWELSVLLSGNGEKSMAQFNLKNADTES